VPKIVASRMAAESSATSQSDPQQQRAGGPSEQGAILIGTDDRPSAQDALALGRWLASARGADLLLAWVHPYDRLPSLLDDGEDVERVREAVTSLAAAVKGALPPELRPELRLLSGRSPAQGLLELADREGVSTIVLGASERSRLGRIAPGSTAVRLLSGSHAPIAIAPRGYAPPVGQAPLIGVGFDGGTEAHEALEWAAGFARLTDGRLRVIGVHQPMAFGDVGVGTFPIESVSQALRRELQEEAEEAVSSLDGVAAEARLRDGDAATSLAAESEDLDLLVLGSRGYGPLRSVLVGSVSEATVPEVRSPVLIVPRGAGRTG
jgi:nucleotide-binding universal stress UspA family protein